MLSCKIAASGDVRFRLNFNRNGGETGFGAIYSAMQQMGLFTRHKSYADMLQRLESFNIGTFSKIRPRCSRERDPTRCSSQRISMAAVVQFGWTFECCDISFWYSREEAAGREHFENIEIEGTWTSEEPLVNHNFCLQCYVSKKGFSAVRYCLRKCVNMRSKTKHFFSAAQTVKDRYLLIKLLTTQQPMNCLESFCSKAEHESRLSNTRLFSMTECATAYGTRNLIVY